MRNLSQPLSTIAFRKQFQTFPLSGSYELLIMSTIYNTQSMADKIYVTKNTQWFDGLVYGFCDFYDRFDIVSIAMRTEAVSYI